MDRTQLVYLFWGYLVAWLGVVGYVASLVLRERRLRGQIALLQQQIRDEDHT